MVKNTKESQTYEKRKQTTIFYGFEDNFFLISSIKA